MTADLNSHHNRIRKTGTHGRAAGLLGALVLAAGLASGAAPAFAESVLTMHIEEQTSWVQNFNPFDLGGRLSRHLDLNVHERHRGPVRGELFDDGSPDSLRAAGHDGHASFEIHLHGSLLGTRGVLHHLVQFLELGMGATLLLGVARPRRNAEWSSPANYFACGRR